MESSAATFGEGMRLFQAGGISGAVQAFEAALAGPGSPNSWMETASLGAAAGSWEARADLAVKAAMDHPLVQARVAAMEAAPGRPASPSCR